MKCVDCILWWADPDEEYPSCKADPNWPAPCEYENDYGEEENDYGEEENDD